VNLIFVVYVVTMLMKPFVHSMWQRATTYLYQQHGFGCRVQCVLFRIFYELIGHSRHKREPQHYAVFLVIEFSVIIIIIIIIFTNLLLGIYYLAICIVQFIFVGYNLEVWNPRHVRN
jgi:hypothetical protein